MRETLRGARRRRAGRCRTAALETHVDLSRNRLETMLKVLDVDGAVRRVRGGWDGHRRSRGPTTPSATPGSPRPASASSRRCSTTSRTDRCRMRFLREQLDDPGADRLRPLRQLRRADAVGDGLRGRRRRGRRSGWPGPASCVEPRKMWPTALANLGLDLKGKIADGAEPRAAPSPGSPTSATARRCATLFRPDTPDGPVPRARWSQAVIEVLDDWRRGPRVRRDRRRRVGDPAAR